MHFIIFVFILLFFCWFLFFFFFFSSRRRHTRLVSDWSSDVCSSDLPHETMQRLIERRPGLAQVEPDALQSHALLITHFDPKSPVAEAYRTLRTNIQFERMERGGKVLVVTSPTLQEGKTTTIVNLALTMAQNGQTTLLVGGNMRRPSIHRFFGIEREPGLSDILVANAQW